MNVVRPATYVEVVGLPGAGKSTVTQVTVPAGFHSQRTYRERFHDGGMSAAKAVAVARLAISNKTILRIGLRSLGDAAVMRRVVNAAIHLVCLRKAVRKNERLYLDRGMIQITVGLVASMRISANELSALLESLSDLVPPVIVHLIVSPETAADRIRTRCRIDKGPVDRMEPSERLQALAVIEEAMGKVLGYLECRKMAHVVSIDAEQQDDSVADLVRNALVVQGILGQS